MNDYEGDIVVFDDMLDYNHEANDPFFTNGRDKNLVVSCLSKTYIKMPEKPMRNKKIITTFSKNFQEIVRT